MRLTDFEINSIKEIFRSHFAITDHIWLFGSRVDMTKKGGDIDLYIETNGTDISQIARQKIAFLVDLKMKIGDQKIDVVINILDANQSLQIYNEAKETGIKLV